MKRRLAHLLLLAAAAILAGTHVGSAAAQSSAPSEVTVTASRAELAPRVLKFVNQIAVQQNDAGLPRWQDPVCPLISGLPRQEGEFTLARISQIASAARVPLAGEHCRPNLFIFVTLQPMQLLQAMANQKRIVTFGDATPTVIDEFIRTPRPVRVWYNTSMRTPEGTSPKQGLPNVAQFLGGSALGGPPVYNDNDRTSHILLSKIWSFSYVFVIIDQARLAAVSRGQFADYVAMVGLADIKPGAHLGDARTILKLFDGAPQAAPEGLTDWDQAFLNSLYATEQISKTQRSHIANSMVRDVLQK
ncbi:MAG TPA: hypothetical protein VIY90_12730 [Steroidobacteraceae bacterium]